MQCEVDPVRWNSRSSNNWKHSKSRALVCNNSSYLAYFKNVVKLQFPPLFWAKTGSFNLCMFSLSVHTEFSRSLLPRPRRLLLLVNPFSGRGQAMQWCQTHILPMIREANISYNLIQTGNPASVKEALWDRWYIYIKHTYTWVFN